MPEEMEKIIINEDEKNYLKTLLQNRNEITQKLNHFMEFLIINHKVPDGYKFNKDLSGFDPPEEPKKE